MSTKLGAKYQYDQVCSNEGPSLFLGGKNIDEQYIEIQFMVTLQFRKKSNCS